MEQEIKDLLLHRETFYRSNEDGSFSRVDMLNEFYEDIKNFLKQEIEKAEERGRTMAIHEISKVLDTEITRWKSDEDGEFDVLRIGFRYFRSTDADDYYSSIEEVQETDFGDWECLDLTSKENKK